MEGNGSGIKRAREGVPRAEENATVSLFGRAVKGAWRWKNMRKNIGYRVASDKLAG